MVQFMVPLSCNHCLGSAEEEEYTDNHTTTEPTSSHAPSLQADQNAATSIAPSESEPEKPIDACDIFLEPIDGDNRPLLPPVQLLNQEFTSVTFSISQTWKEGTIDWYALLYASDQVSDQELICATFGRVPWGDTQIFSAKCADGITEAWLYVQDSTFSRGSNDIPQECSRGQDDSAFTVAYKAVLPCWCNQDLVQKPTIHPPGSSPSSSQQ